MSEMNERIEHDFTYHQPTTLSTVRLTNLRARARDLAHYIDEIVPDSREKSLAITHLEDSVMWANAGIVRNQVPTDANGNPYKHPEISSRWATTYKTVMCSECSFEINSDSMSRYTPCSGGCWVPVTT